MWIEISKVAEDLIIEGSHSLYESVNWNIYQKLFRIFIISHSLYESVNWNKRCLESTIWGKTVTLFTRVWIEILFRYEQINLMLVTLFTRVWIEIIVIWEWLYIQHVTLFTRVWIEILCFFFNFVNCFVTLFTRVWIEIINSKGKLNNAFCHSLYESVNWNVFIFIIINFIYSHSLYESVNWNNQVMCFIEV